MTRSVAFLAVFFASDLAFAQASGDDRARSKAAFDEARKLVDAGKCEAAIPKLLESVRLFPSVGARLTLADCHARDAPLSAWRELKAGELSAIASGDDRASIAHARAKELLPRLAAIALELPLSDADDPGLEVRIDGAPFDKLYWYSGAPIAVDPGKHVVGVTTPKREFSQTVEATIGSTAPVRVSLSERIVKTTPPPAIMTPPPPPPPSTQKWIGVSIAGAGLASILVGTIVGAVVLQKRGDLDQRCKPGTFPGDCGDGTMTSAEQAAIASDYDAAKTLSWVSTATFIGGATLLAAGAVVFFTAPKASRVTIGWSGLGLRVGGTF